MNERLTNEKINEIYSAIENWVEGGDEVDRVDLLRAFSQLQNDIAAVKAEKDFMVMAYDELCHETGFDNALWGLK